MAYGQKRGNLPRTSSWHCNGEQRVNLQGPWCNLRTVTQTFVWSGQIKDHYLWYISTKMFDCFLPEQIGFEQIQQKSFYIKSKWRMRLFKISTHSLTCHAIKQIQLNRIQLNRPWYKIMVLPAMQQNTLRAYYLYNSTMTTSWFHTLINRHFLHNHYSFCTATSHRWV